MSTKWHLCVVFVLVAAISLRVHALDAVNQTQQPVSGAATFRSDVRVAVQSITVKDKNGNAIEGLTAQDFSVTEDEEPQQVAFVEFQRLSPAGALAPMDAVVPNHRAADAVTPVVTSDTLSNTLSDIRYRDRRLLVLYFDLTAMPSADRLRALGAAQKYVGRLMTDADLVRIMTLDRSGVQVVQEFTDNRKRLLATIGILMFGEDQDGDGASYTKNAGTAFGQDDAEFNIFNIDRQLAAVQTAVSLLGRLPEQKTMLYFTSGLQLNSLDNTAQLRATTNAAIRANVSISTVDARGLVAEAPLGDATTPSLGGIAMFTGHLAEARSSRFQRSQDTLYALAKDTGGTALLDYNDLSLGIVKAANAVSSYYVLGFYTTHSTHDGRFRRVRVTLSRDIAAELSYRRGYFADKTFGQFTGADKERQLEEALMLDDPITEITIAVEVNYFQISQAEYFVPVAVKIPGSELARARKRGAARTQLDFIGEVKDEFGVTIQNVRDKVDIRLSDETAAELAKRPLLYETGFTLLPGKYVIKLLARDTQTGRIGTYQSSFAIPNLMREAQGLPISSVVLGSQRIALNDALHSVKGTTTQTANPLVTQGMKLIPSVSRVFSRGRDLYVFLEAYPHDLIPHQQLVAYMTFFRDGTKVFETSPVVFKEGLEGHWKAVPVGFSLALSSLATGRYDCQVTVLAPGSQKAAFWRASLALVP
jgi:VWFA-related protein